MLKNAEEIVGVFSNVSLRITGGSHNRAKMRPEFAASLHELAASLHEFAASLHEFAASLHEFAASLHEEKFSCKKIHVECF